MAHSTEGDGAEEVETGREREWEGEIMFWIAGAYQAIFLSILQHVS